jgi:hypothetical protein
VLGIVGVISALLVFVPVIASPQYGRVVGCGIGIARLPHWLGQRAGW